MRAACMRYRTCRSENFRALGKFFNGCARGGGNRLQHAPNEGKRVCLRDVAGLELHGWAFHRES